jgi:hypothetical protein
VARKTKAGVNRVRVIMREKREVYLTFSARSAGAVTGSGGER